jgi:hypothetical protein
VATEAQGGSVLLLDGGEGTTDRGGDGEVAEAGGASVRTRCSSDAPVRPSAQARTMGHGGVVWLQWR